ncbi:unnamed protein product [Brassicogethes aeneus]|uniref:Peptidase S1 domain-containing protein n=1 Tax=Brassicogethes aeneus TaxID=1431903 RepID=A0A9P0AKW1_BRAAE|nr:unnamed protein product [Brassicogethes aeneus]
MASSITRPQVSLYKPTNDEFSVRYGSTYLPAGKNAEVSNIICNQDDDVAILQLNNPMQPSENWAVATLAQNSTPSTKKTATIVGWGSTEQNGPITYQLRELTVEIYPKCWPRTICFGSLQGGLCKGDSGSPVMMDNTVIGVNSFITSLNCESSSVKNPNGAVDISKIYPWIFKNI